MAVKITHIETLVGKTIYSQRGLVGEKVYVVDATGFDSGFFWVSATEVGGTQVKQLKSSSLEGLAVKVWGAGK